MPTGIPVMFLKLCRRESLSTVRSFRQSLCHVQPVRSCFHSRATSSARGRDGTDVSATSTDTFTIPASSLESNAFRRRAAVSLVRTSEPSPPTSRRWKTIFSRSVEHGCSVNVKARQSYHSALPSNDVEITGNTACTPSGICTVATSSCHLAEDWSLNL